MAVAKKGSNGLPKIEGLSLDDLDKLADHVADVLQGVRKSMLRPEARKNAPRFSGAQVAQLCALKHSNYRFHLNKGQLPQGRVVNNARREFTLQETRQWVRAFRAEALRPEGARAITVTVGLFKGGVGKTTIAASLAQGLSLRGHRVLLLDLDPQGSLTTLMGFLPDAEIEANETLLPLFSGDEDDVRFAVRPTYWDGIDLIPACPALFGAEFHLPARQMREEGLRFWEVLDRGLEPVRDEYDVIVIDTPPALSYVTANAFLAADGLIVPLPPNTLDFASSSQFWSLFSDVTTDIRRITGYRKYFRFLHVLLNKVSSNNPSAEGVSSWIMRAYGERVLPVVIPETSVAAVASTEFGTVYDVTRYGGSARTYRRAREAYDEAIDMIEASIRAAWLTEEVMAAPAAEEAEHVA